MVPGLQPAPATSTAASTGGRPQPTRRGGTPLTPGPVAPGGFAAIPWPSEAEDDSPDTAGGMRGGERSCLVAPGAYGQAQGDGMATLTVGVAMAMPALLLLGLASVAAAGPVSISGASVVTASLPASAVAYDCLACLASHAREWSEPALAPAPSGEGDCVGAGAAPLQLSDFM
mmetsp:Transcript_26179/g.57160  ORF Transcript_26179/g.57160 Transcript_26179/m.57160 type:complete len:173 (-) Transcript_26179:214-732(-)